MWQERANYGHFFYRIPNGESAADAYDRVSGFNESLWRSFGETDFASVCVLVTHGLMTRVFLMKWYHFSVEYFEDLRNMNHCEFIVMKKNPDNEKYILQNQLRTWSELKREREESSAKSPIPVRKMWDGHPEHSNEEVRILARRQARRQNTADLFSDDGTPNMEPFKQALLRRTSKKAANPSSKSHSQTREAECEEDPQERPESSKIETTATTSRTPKTTISQKDENKPACEDRDDSVDDADLHTLQNGGPPLPHGGKEPPKISSLRSMARAISGAFDEEYGNGMRKDVRADALGDRSDMDDEDEDEDGDGDGDCDEGVVREVEREERVDRSFEGSVW